MRRLLIAIIAAIAVLIATLIAVSPAAAQGPGEGVIVNDRYLLSKDQVHPGNLTVFAREVALEVGSRVDGNLSVVASGKVILNGEINGNVSVLAPDAQLGSGLRVNGNLSICARHVNQSPEAVVSGEQSAGCDQLGAIFSGTDVGGRIRAIRGVPFDSYNENPIARIFRVIVTSCAVAALAALLAIVFPQQMRRMTETAMSVPATTGAVGFMSLGVVLAITLVYLLSIVLTLGLMCIAFPIFGAVWLAVWVGLIVGWIAVSVPFGTYLMHRLKVHPTPMVAAALGTLALTLAQGLLEMLPCIGWLSWVMLVILGSVGFGAVVLTRFGVRPYPEIMTARVRTEIV